MNDLSSLNKSFCDDVFIFASGGSAKDFPLFKYKDKNFICVNGSVSIFIESGISPLVYLFNDESFLINSLSLVLEAIRISDYIFIPEELYLNYIANELGDNELCKKIYFISRVNRRYKERPVSDRAFAFKNIFNKSYEYSFNIFSKQKNRIGFSRDISKGYFCARTIPYVALQLAYYLGFSRVFFIGLDLNSSVGRFYSESDILPTTLDEDYSKHIYPSFELASKRVFSENFKVYNLSTQSKLPSRIVPKITLSQLAGLIDE